MPMLDSCQHPLDFGTALFGSHQQERGLVPEGMVRHLHPAHHVIYAENIGGFAP
jgi:hypothetical protein